jgi:cytochrome c553
MYPFAKELTDAQELANVSAYIESLCIPVDHGKYEGPDAAAQIATGKALYEKQCVECHGKNGEGEKAKFYPVIAGQHYKYLLRQMTEIRDGHRRNANPDMVKVIKPYTNDQLVAISAYQASLSMPGSMCKAVASPPPRRRRSNSESWSCPLPPAATAWFPRSPCWPWWPWWRPIFADLVGVADGAQLPQGRLPRRHPHPLPLRRRQERLPAAGAGHAHGAGDHAGDLGADSERYNPITRRQEGRQQGRAGAGLCSRDEHHQPLRGHVPHRHRRAGGKAAGQVLLRLLRGDAARLHAITQKKLRLAVLGVGFAAVAAWAIVDQYVLGHLAQHVADYVKEAGTFFKEPDKIKVWGDNVTLASHAVIAAADGGDGHRVGGRGAAARLRAAAGAGAGAAAGVLRHRVRRLAVVLRAQPAPLGRVHGQALHAHRVRRRQGGAVQHLLVPLLGLRAAGGGHAPACCWRCCCGARQLREAAAGAAA